jgi:alkylation response protein AidB-like acyl-CoA dehydrogenase
MPCEFGGQNHRLLTHTLAYETLAQGCPATALAFNMHASVVMPLIDSDEVTPDAERRLADLVAGQGLMIGGNFSEPGTTSLMGERPLSVRAKPVEGGWRITGRKMFASMLEAADRVLVMAYPEDSSSPTPASC